MKFLVETGVRGARATKTRGYASMDDAAYAAARWAASNGQGSYWSVVWTLGGNGDARVVRSYNTGRAS